MLTPPSRVATHETLCGGPSVPTASRVAVIEAAYSTRPCRVKVESHGVMVRGFSPVEPLDKAAMADASPDWLCGTIGAPRPRRLIGRLAFVGLSPRRSGPIWSINGQVPRRIARLSPAHCPTINEYDRSGLGQCPSFMTLDGGTARKGPNRPAAWVIGRPSQVSVARV